MKELDPGVTSNCFGFVLSDFSRGIYIYILIPKIYIQTCRLGHPRVELQMVAARSKAADDLRPLATDMGIKDLAADLRKMMDAEDCAVAKGTEKVSRALPALGG